MYDIYLYHMSSERRRRDSQFWQVWTGCNVANQYAKKGKSINPFKILGLKKPKEDKVKAVEDIEIEEIPNESKLQRGARIAAVMLERESRKNVRNWDMTEVD